MVLALNSQVAKSNSCPFFVDRQQHSRAVLLALLQFFVKVYQLSLLQQSNAHEKDGRTALLHALGHHHLELLSHYKKCRNHELFSVQF